MVGPGTVGPGTVGALVRAAAVVILTGATILGIAAPARAGGPGESITGDFNGDGRADSAVLTAVAAHSVDCQITVSASGEPQRTYTYLSLADGQYCPDMGTAAQVDGTGPDEIVLGWFAGPPPSIDYELLTLQLFAVIGTARAIWQPCFLGRADFNGDGRDDLYEWTDQGEGYRTYLSTGTGTFEPGPQRHPGTPSQLVIRDLNHNRAMDTLLSYVDYDASGVAVLLDGGSVQDLQRDRTAGTSWTVRVVNVNGDRYPDVLTIDRNTHRRTYFVNTGTGRFVRVPGV
ncbi:VCBS repeat-containing protein [Plantactinospora sp. KBS50]|uniref:FG-GAP repeat domain-containing protein n=1 Tax=Plantactinospora sp. KBS50 TaxID=2024580 RepID=UPI0012FE49B5|nr:VCBS repeat-containing protein [Plantactinospora sp. KBS50]